MNEKLRQVRPADVLFKPGAVVATPGALATFTRDELFTALMRHVTGDWGDVECCDVVDLGCIDTDDQCDWHQNTWSRLHDERILSSYRIREQKLWVITERDRSATTMLTPDEY